MTNEKLSRAERQILANQYRILEHLEPDAGEDWQLLRQALEDGYELEYYEYDAPLPESECILVLDILDMCWLLQKDLAEHDDLPELHYRYVIEEVGFDGNYETKHMAYARFLVDQPDKFEGLTTAFGNLNSHSPMLPIYKQLLARYKEECNMHYRYNSYPLPVDAIIRILEEKPEVS